MKNKKLFILLFMIALAVAAFIPKEQPETPIIDGLQLTFVNVGQGDAAFIKTKTGETWLIDGGEDKMFDTQLMPFLSEQGVDTLDFAVVTHFHNDHIGGIFQLLKRGKIKTLILPDYEPDSKAKPGLLKNAEIAHTAVLDVSVGDLLPTGDENLKISVLHPQKGGFSPDNENNNSMVLRLEYMGSSALLTGDIESYAEAYLLKNHPLEADILKLGHHGSNTSTEEGFIRAVDPVYGVISAGKDNRYGHPHYEVLDRLSDNDVMVYRTDQDGDITFVLGDNGIHISTEKNYAKE